MHNILIILASRSFFIVTPSLTLTYVTSQLFQGSRSGIFSRVTAISAMFVIKETVLWLKFVSGQRVHCIEVSEKNF